GIISGSISIPNDVPGKNPYVVALQGTAGPMTGNSDDFGYTMATAAPAAAASFLLPTDSDVFAPAGLLRDDEFLTADLGFTFYFYDKAYTSCFIATNGIITFSNGTTAYTPATIPTQSQPDNFIAPFW